ncbi:MAG: DoxX family protein [Deltaproteobacteria bacterium]
MGSQNRWLFLIPRVSLGVVFLIFGIGKFRDDLWAQTIRSMDFFGHLPWPVQVSVVAIGILETVTGALLVLGCLTRVAAGLAAMELCGILFLLNFQEVRDIGLLGMAVYLACLTDAGPCLCGLGPRKPKGHTPS